MIAIYAAATHTQLDLDPESTFEITHEQPMLDSSHTPVPYSTSISFLPSEKNKEVFAFLGGAMLLEPAIKRLEAEIWIGGFKILSGILVYDAYEDGLLKYSFSGRNLEDDWNAKIWTQVNPLLSTIPSSYTLARKQEYIQAIKEGTHFLAAPVLINKEATAYTVYGACDWAEKVEPSIKYHNWPAQQDVIFTPVFRVNLILEKIMKNIIMDDSLLTAYRQLAIIAQYKPDGHYNSIGIPLLGEYDCQNMLPDISVYDVIQNLARMFCAAIYKDDTSLRFLSANAILSDPDFKDWSDKIADIASFSKEEATSYVLQYKNSDEDNVYDVSNLSEDLEDGDVITADNLIDVVKSFGRRKAGDQDDTEDVNEPVKGVRHAVTKDIYSGKYLYLARPSIQALPVCDIVYHHNPKINTATSDDDSSFDNSIDFNLVKCLPEAAKTGESSYRNCLCPVISPATIGSPRGDEIYIGILVNNQLVDKGISFDPAKGYISSDKSDADCGISLAPDALFNAYHKEFADWLATERQVVSIDLNLTISDIIEFRMFNKVRFHNRLWLVKKLSLTILADSDHIRATGEFIAL